MPLLSPEITGIVVVSLLMVWLFLGAHIGVALGLAGFLGIYLSVGPDAAFAKLRPFLLEPPIRFRWP